VSVETNAAVNLTGAGDPERVQGARANVANLMLARGAVRAREVAIRAALGGDRWALARPVLAESLLLALFGGGLGILVANLGVEALLAVARDQLPRSDRIGVDGTVVAFTLCLSVVCGVLFGIAPALQGSRYKLQEALKEGGRSGTDTSGRRIRRALIVAEVALALTLLVGAGLLIKSFGRLLGVDPGFDPRNVLTFHLALPHARYPDPPSQRRFFDDALARVAQLPGVKGAGATTVMPFSGQWTTGTFTVEGHKTQAGESEPWGDIRIVTIGFLETLRVPLLQGRTFTSADRDGARQVALTRVLQGQLYAVRPTDPATFAMVGAIIASVALLASLFPALRATRIDPAVALRDE
jgi:predicted permease